MSHRQATLADIDAMHEVRLAVQENRLSDPDRIRPEHYRSMLAEHGCGWVYEVEGKVVGFAIADHSCRNIWALHDLMVKWLFEQGHEPLWLTTAPDTRAEQFYAAAGWQCRGTEKNGELRFELMQTSDR